MYGALAQFGLVGMVFHGQIVHLPLGPVGQFYLQGVEHGHSSGGALAQVVPHAGFQQRPIHCGIGLGHPHPGQEVLNGLGRIAPAAHGHQGGHPGIVPAGDVALLHQAAQVALAHHGAGEVQPGELDLPGRMLKPGLTHHPIVQGTVYLVFQGAQGVGHPFDGVLEGMLEIVHGVDAPLISGLVVMVAQDAVQGGVPHEHVGGGHIDLGPQDPAAVGELPVPHPLEQVQVFLHRPVTIGAVHPGLGQGAPVLPHLLRGLVVHIGHALFDELAGDIVQPLEKVAGKV